MENFDPPDAPAGAVSNVPEFSVSELSFALKREIETAFPRVRVRGEISQPSFPRSGHCYFRLKDENAVIDGVAWKGTIPRLGIKIEEGLEVIATGKLTTYAGSSRYQIVVDRLELAGEGALLKLLEDRRKKLQAEGLFDPERKRALPFLPEVIGVVTSPTGAVIRDILHRLADRFPRHVLVWPVAVQGEKAAAEVAAAIAGFNRLAGRRPGAAARRADRGARRRQPGRPLGLQRGDRGARRRGLGDPADLGGRPRDRHHPDRLRLRPPRADADRRGRDGGAGARRPPDRDAGLRQATGRRHDPTAARIDHGARGSRPWPAAIQDA